MYNITFVKTYMQNYAKKYKDIAILFIFFVYYRSIVRLYNPISHTIYQVSQKEKSHFRLSSSICDESLCFLVIFQNTISEYPIKNSKANTGYLSR